MSITVIILSIVIAILAAGLIGLLWAIGTIASGFRR